MVPLRVAVHRHGAEFAGYIDDASGRRTLEKRKHCLGHTQSSDEVGVQHPANNFEIGYAGATISGRVNACVVHENVEMAALRLNLESCRLNRLIVGCV